MEKKSTHRDVCVYSVPPPLFGIRSNRKTTGTASSSNLFFLFSYFLKRKKQTNKPKKPKMMETNIKSI
jgi:hypothetical protein